MSTVTIIGTGNMARSIAVRALAGGYREQLLGHSSERPNNWQRTWGPTRSRPEPGVIPSTVIWLSCRSGMTQPSPSCSITRRAGREDHRGHHQPC